jgi:acetolactate synthase-1/2/3 large subunit
MAATPLGLRSGGQILVDALRTHGVDAVFCVPGESYLAVLDALHDARDRIRLLSCRQEGGAAFMAEAYGKLTGRPGICLVTRGPGACNAAIGVHTARQDSTPLILFVGQVARDQVEREAFQEVDFRQMYGPLAKWVAQVDDPARLPELVSRAFHTATAGRPGPVVLALPEDMLTERVAVADAGRYQVVRPHPSPAALAAMRRLLAGAARPLVIAGGSGWTAEGCRDFAAFAEANGLPVACTFRRQDLLDNEHPSYVGDLGTATPGPLADRVKQADVLLVVGTRLGEVPTQGYTLVTPPRPKQTLIHVHADAEELGRVYQADVAINAGPAEWAAAARALRPVDGPPWGEWTAAARRDHLATREPDPCPGEVDMPAVMALIRESLPPEAIVTNGAGNYTGWVHRYYRYRRFGTQLAPTSGAMGYGVPAAVAAKVVHPGRPVVGFAGDGCFLMTGQELATALQYGLDPVLLVINNGMYGTIRMHQEREYPGRVSGTDLVNPDFAGYARAFGAHAEVVVRTAEFAPAWERARRAGRAALIELRVDPEAITTRTSLSAIRARAAARRTG